MSQRFGGAAFGAKQSAVAAFSGKLRRFEDGESRRREFDVRGGGEKCGVGDPGESAGVLRAEISCETNRFGQMAGSGIDDPLRIAGVSFLDVFQVDVLGRFGGKRGDHDGAEGREQHGGTREPG